jgi:sugar-specific transcriptional regulator TrmB
MTKRATPQQSIYIESAIKAGLSAKAAAIYIALLEAGEPISPKSMIIRTGLHRQYVYDAIRELQERALISSSGKDRAVRYVAMSPNKLVQEVEKKRIDTLDGVQVLTQLYNRSATTPIEIVPLDNPPFIIGSENSSTDERLASIEQGLQEVKEAVQAFIGSERGHTV